MRREYHVVAPLLLVIMASTCASLLLTAAAVVWLSGYFGTLITPCLLVGVLWGVLAIVVYRLSLGRLLRHAEHSMEILFDLARLIRHGYRYVQHWLGRTESL